MKKKTEKGFALVLSIVLLLVMSLMGGSLIVISAGDHQSNNTSDEYQQTFYVAETALLEAEKIITNKMMGPWIVVDDEYAAPPTGLNDSETASWNAMVENLKNEAKVTLIEIKKRQNEVQKEIELIHKDAKNKIKKIEEATEQKLNDQIQKRQVLASAKIDQLTRDASHEIQQHIASTAIEATVTLLQKKLDINEKKNLINVSINELNSVLKN